MFYNKIVVKKYLLIARYYCILVGKEINKIHGMFLVLSLKFVYVYVQV